MFSLGLFILHCSQINYKNDSFKIPQDVLNIVHNKGNVS